MELDEEWIEYVNAPMKKGELHNIRNSVNRQAPLGDEKWQVETATKYGLLFILNERGRPRKDVIKVACFHCFLSAKPKIFLY